MPDEEEGRPAPEELLKLILANAPVGADVPLRQGNLELPASHPGSGLTTGQSKVVSGVTIQSLPTAGAKIHYAGVPDEIVAGVDLTFKEDAPLTRVESSTQKLATAFAPFFGMGLPPAHLDRLKELYRSSAAQSTELRKRLAGNQISKDEARAQLAALMGKLVLDEMAIFAGQGEAQKNRYKNWSGATAPSGPLLVELLTKTLLGLLKGEYLSRDAMKVRVEQETLRFGSKADAEALKLRGREKNGPELNRRAHLLPLGEHVLIAPTQPVPAAAQPILAPSGILRPTRDLAPTQPGPTPAQTVLRPVRPISPIVDSVIVQDIPEGNPETLAWEARVYTAEHSVLHDANEAGLEAATGINWDEICSDLGLVHTSVVGGIWRRCKQQFLRKIYTRSLGLGGVVHTGGIVAVDSATSVEEVKQTKYWDEFDEWHVANGCASWMNSDDTLILRYVACFSSWMDAYKWLKGSTPSEGAGKYYPIRACSYSVGDYGINWVCHQNANAFAMRKWGILLVAYPSTLMFGSCGTGTPTISTREDPIYRQIHYGGVPGNWLFYEVTPPYAWLGLLTNVLMDGGGLGLDYRWNPNKQGWYPTFADFSPRLVPFRGPESWYYVQGWE